METQQQTAEGLTQT